MINAKNTFLEFITSDKMAFLSIIAGTLFGIYFPKLAINFEPLNNVYIQLFQLVILPFLILTIITGVFALVTNNSQLRIQTILGKIILMFVAVFILALTISYLTKPWAVMINDPQLLKVVYRGEPNLQATSLSVNDIIDPAPQKESLSSFIVKNIPRNIFEALASGQLLQITIFSIILAIGLAYWTKHEKNMATIQAGLENTLNVFKLINDKMLLALPVMSFFMIAYQLKGMSATVFTTLFSLIGTLLLTYLVLFILFILIICWRSNQSFLKVITSLKSCLIIAFLSRSPFIASSRAIESMTTELGFSQNIVKLVMPLGVSLIRFSALATYTIAILFAMHIFNMELSLMDIGLFFTLLVFASIVSVGCNNPLAFYQNISVVSSPLGIPTNSIISIFLSIDFILEPLDAMTNMLGLCALSALSAKPEATSNADVS